MASSPPPGELNLRAQIDITVLLSTLTERTYEGLVHQHSFLRDRAINDTIRTKMRLLCDLHGVEAYLFFIRWLLTYYAFAIRRRRAETSPSLAFRLLVQEVHGMARDPFLAPRFCHAIGEAIEDEPEFLQYFNLTHFVQQSNLGPLEKFVLASSIASTKSGSFNRELVEQGIRMARSNFDQAMGELVSRPNFEPPLRWTAASGLLSEAADNLSSSQLNELLDNVLIDSKGSILDARQRAKLISTTRSIFPMIVVIRESGNPSRTLSSFSSITVNGNAELSRVPLGTDPPRTASSKFGILTSQWYNTQTRTLNSKEGNSDNSKVVIRTRKGLPLHRSPFRSRSSSSTSTPIIATPSPQKANGVFPGKVNIPAAFLRSSSVIPRATNSGIAPGLPPPRTNRYDIPNHVFEEDPRPRSMVPPDLPIDHHRSHVSIATSEEDRDRSSSPPPYMSPGTAPSPRMVALEDPGTRPEILGPRSFKQEINGVETSKEQTLPSQSRLEISSNTPTTCIPAPSLQHPPWLLGLLLELSEVDSRNLVGKITQHEVLKGHGSFGKVYQGVYKGEIVCVKVLKEVRTSASEGVITKFCRRMMREVKVWSTLRHSNVVTFHGWTVGCSPETDVTCAKLISAWCEGGNVGEYLRKTPNADRRRLVLGAARGLQYLHLKDVIHGDIKPENIVVSAEGIAMLCDFGLSCTLLDSSTYADGSSTAGTTRYTAPEVLSYEVQHRDRKSDMWAFGCTSGQILFDLRPYHASETNFAVLRAISDGRAPFEWDGPDEFLASISCCLERNPNERLTIEELVLRLDH